MTAFPMPWPASLWADTAVARTAGAPLSGDHVADVVIIGGGYTGLSAAHRLSGLGMMPVVLEANEVGWGASGRNGGVVSTKFRLSLAAIARSHGLDAARRMSAIGHEAVDAVAGLVDEFDIRRAGLEMNGNLRCAHNPRALEALEKEAGIVRAIGGSQDVRTLSAEEVAEETGSAKFVGGVLAQHAGLIHPLNYARGLADGLRSRGITLFEGTPALKLRREGQQVIVETPGGAVRSRRVLLATNGYSSMTPVTTGVRKAVVPFRSAIIATEPLGQNLRRSVMSGRRSYSETRRMMRWFRPFGDRMLFGGRGAFGKTDSTGAFETLHRAMVELFPQLDGTAISHRWSGLVGMTLDSVPQVGSLDEHVGYALGYNGAGIAMATLMGRYAADMTAGIPCDLALMNTTGLKTIPFYAVREPIVRLVAGWYQFLDAQGF